MAHALRDLTKAGEAWIDVTANHQLALIFVHGWTGHYKDTWTWEENRSRWGRSSDKLQRCNIRELLTTDSSLCCDYFFIAQSSGFFDKASINQQAQSVNAFVRNYVTNKYIIFVTHSLGGLICRRALINSLSDDSLIKDRTLGLIMYGTPHTGTEIAYAAGLSGSFTAQQMKPYTEVLGDLNRDWVRHVVNGGSASEPLSRRFPHLICQVVIGELDKVVPPSSGTALTHLGQVDVIQKDHMGLSKAQTNTDPTYVTLKRFVERCSESLAERPLLESTVFLQDRLAKDFIAAHTKQDWSTEETHKVCLSRSDRRISNLSSPILACEFEVLRKGGSIKDEFLIGIRMDGAGYQGAEPDESIAIGQGFMSNATFAKFAEMLRTCSVSIQELNKLVNVSRILVKGEKEGKQRTWDYTYSDLIKGSGFAIIKYKWNGPIDWSQIIDPCFELKYSTFMVQEQKWYTHEVEHPITKKLTIELEAPYTLTPLLPFGKEYAKELVTKESFPIAEATSGSRIIVNGPVAKGTPIRWLFSDLP